jgi:outer membrane protein OmpA-like peptidoglycan-associated protein
MKSPYALLLASSVIFATYALQAPVHGAGLDRVLVVAQSDKHNDKKDAHKNNQKGKQQPAKQPQKKPEAKKPAAHQQPKPQQKSAAPQKQQNRPGARSEAKPQSKPAPRANKPQQQQRSRAADEQRHQNERRGGNANNRNDNHNKPAAQNQREQNQHKGPRQQQRPQNANERGKPTAPAAAQKQEQQQKSATPTPAPNKQQADHNKNRNAEQHRNTEQNRQGNAEQNRRGNTEQRNRNAEKPQPVQPQQQAQPNRPGAPQPAPTATERNRQNNEPHNARAPEPVKPHRAAEFIRKKGEKPTRTIEQVRQQRTQTREGNRVIIREGDRTIVHNDKRTIIRHNETQRFAVGARNVRTEHGKNNENVTIIERPNGVRIVNITDEHGRLIRRLRRDRAGHDVVIIDDSSFRRRRPDVDVYVDLPPVHIRDRDRYYVYADRATPAAIFAALTAAPIVALQERYTVDQVRYSYPLRERMPRVDLDIHFDSGSWQLTPDQIGRLQAIADGLNRAIDRNPREVFLIEGHTDAVGSPEDNLSLSDRRAVAVAVALTEQFHVPPENLLTQGYGEEHLKVQTEGSSRENRRVTVLRITPLIAQAAQ